MLPQNAGRATLVFPAVNQAAVEYLRAAQARGEPTVCAASVASDEIAAEWGGLHRLPSIYACDFSQRFLSLVETHSIARLFCPVASVHVHMRRLIDEHGLRLALIGESPIGQQVEQHRQLMARAKRLWPLALLCADGAPTISLLEMAGVLRQASLIYGESNDDKLAAMAGIFADAPAGDVVEIGTLMGRSAFVLLYLARRHRIGPLLSIDPWLPFNSIMQDAPTGIRAMVDEWDYDVMRDGFVVNMVPFFGGDHAHLMVPSERAFQAYSRGESMQSSFYGEAKYSGGIAVLHIDGNHDYDSVRNDRDLWLTRMLPNSWLILDDYIWTHGDGPNRIGNDLLHEAPDRVVRAFVCGKALFVKFRH